MRACISVALCWAVGLAAAPVLVAQEVLQEFSYENLRFSGIQGDLGILTSHRLKDALVGGIRVDYGFFAPRLRVLIGLSYVSSEFDDEETDEFETRIRALVRDPSGDDTIDVGEIRWRVFIGDLDFQYLLTPNTARVFVYLGGGFSVHLRNGSGPAVDDTFVEDALDTIEAGFNLTTTAEIALHEQVRLTIEGRGTVTDGLRMASARFGLMYRVGESP